MKKPYQLHTIPRTRIATFDIYAVGMQKHHVPALLEFDVTDSRKKIRELRRSGEKISFNAWLLKVIGKTLELHPVVSSYLKNKKSLITFNDINISIMVEKDDGDKKVPIPLVLEKVNEKSITEITTEIEKARQLELSKEDIVLNRKSQRYERIYYRLPESLRRVFWRYLLRHPHSAYRMMGNAVVTSLGPVGRINGWFIHNTVHPVSFGVGSVIKKPVVVNDEIKIREILNMTVLFDHDVIDGAPMVRFVNDLTKFIEKDN
ncbi:MAG TPA: 2-oxo acid dehydrogenase subunit E2 [Bacteroidales bacterium]|nr:2-oxo acid dehydrogenase subunit E2 [Bacteroidales bacterium]